ncbi:serine-rich adhesin for platelets-like [Macrobrachium nipponense]|uniref:serine-rich adhesin for platelets-like n=1 Tax=Macrobrachium nipponense TaxID=159736 RepID=UPI0030C8B632
MQGLDLKKTQEFLKYLALRSHSGVITTQNGDASTTTQSGDDSSKGSSTVSDSRTFSHGPLTTQVSARSLIGQPVLVPIKSALSSTSTSTATASTANASPTVVTTGIGKSNAQEVTPQSSSSSTSHSSQSAHTVPHFGGTSTTNLSKVSASRTFSSLAEATEASNPITNESAAFNKRTGTTGTTIQSDGNTPVPHFTISINSAPSKQLGSSTSSFISTDEEVSQPKTAGQPIRGAFSSASTSTGASPAAPFSTHASVGSESAKGGVSSPSIVLPTSSDGPAPSRALSRVNFASIRDSAGAAVPGSSSTATSSTVNLGPQEIVQHSLFPTATTSASTSTRDSTASAPAASLSPGDATTVRGRTRVPVRTDHSSASSSSIGSSQSSTVLHFGGAFPSDLPQSSASSSSSITTARDDVSHSIKSSPFPTLSASTVTGTTSTLPFESTFSSRSNTDVVPETGFSASHSSASLITPSSSPINKGSHSSSFSTTDSSNTSFSSTSSFSPNIQRVLQLVNLGQPAFIPAASALISTRNQPSETAQSSLSKATTSTGSSQSINLVPHFSSTSPSGLSKTTNSNSISSPRSNPVTIIQSPSISALSSTGTSSKVSSSGSKLPSKVSGTTSTTLVPEERIPVSSSFVFSKPPGSSSKEFTSSASSGTSKDNKFLQLPISVHLPLVSTLTSKEASTTSGSARASERAGSKHKNALVSRIGLVSDGDLSVAPASSSSSSTAATKITIAPQAVSQSAKVLVTGSSSALPTSSRNTMAESLQASSSSAASSATSASTGTSASTNTRDSGNSVDSSVRESTISLSDRQAHIGNVINFATAGGARFFGTGHPPTIPTVAIPIVTSGALVEPRLGSAGTFGSNTPVFLANTVQASTPVIHSVPTTFLTGGHSNHPVVHGQNLALSSPLSIFSVPRHQIIGIDAVQG